VGNIVTGTDAQTQCVLNCDALAHFQTLLNHHKEKINKVDFILYFIFPILLPFCDFSLLGSFVVPFERNSRKSTTSSSCYWCWASSTDSPTFVKGKLISLKLLFLLLVIICSFFLMSYFQGEFQTQKEAAWAVTNLTISGRKQQVAYLVQCGVISPFCHLLSCKDPQVKLDF
jgi:hypothetical protein